MVGRAPVTAPPGYGSEFADRSAQSRRLDQAMVEGDLNRRSSLMQNIISNAPNIAALSGTAAVDDLAHMFADSETPIFGNEYGLQSDELNRAMQLARLAGANRSSRPTPGSGDNLQVGQFVGTDGKIYKWSDFDESAQATLWGGGTLANGVQVAIGGPDYTGPHNFSQPRTGGGGDAVQEVYDPELDATFDSNGNLIRKGK